MRGLARAAAFPGPRVIVAEEKPEVLAGAERLAGAGQHQHLGCFILGQGLERIAHFEMHLRAHRVALFRSVEDQPGDPVVAALDLDRVVFPVGHRAASLVLMTTGSVSGCREGRARKGLETACAFPGKPEPAPSGRFRRGRVFWPWSSCARRGFWSWCARPTRVSGNRARRLS